MRAVVVLSIVMMLGAGTAWGQQTTTQTEKVEPPRKAFTGFEPILAFSLGYMEPDSLRRTESYPANFKILGSFYPDNAKMAYDFGFGFQEQRFRQKIANSDNHIKGGIIEAAARAKVSSHWEAGPIWNTFMNEGHRYGATTNETNYLGLQVLRQISFTDHYAGRIGARYMTDTNIDHGQVNVAYVDLQFGLRANDKNEVAMASVPTTAVANPAAVLAGVGVGHLNFTLNSSRLAPEDQAYVSRLGEAINRHRNDFDSLEVIGHTDQTGTEDYNNELSRKRAEEVSKLLTRSAPLREKITVNWHGESDPLVESNTPEALRLNRRVELVFRGIRQPNLVETLIQEVQ